MAKFTRIALIPLFLFFLMATQAFAEYTTDKAAFMAEYPDLWVQDFSASTIPPGEDASCNGPIDSSSNNACVTPGLIHPGLAFSSDGLMNGLTMFGPMLSGFNNPNHSLCVGETGTAFEIFFTEEHPVNVVGLDIGCFTKSEVGAGCTGTFKVDVFGFLQQAVGGFEIQATDEFDTFLGISSHELIARVTISPLTEETGFIVGVDAVYYGFFTNVPTMSEWGLLATIAGLGVIGFFVIRRRKQAVS